MKILLFAALTLIVFELAAFSDAIDYDEGCFIGDNLMPFVQLATVMDCTGTFTLEGGTRNFYRQFSELVPTLFSEINKDYPGSVFGHTIHGDWEGDARPPNTTETPHQDPEGCYTRVVEFTTNTASFVTRMLDINILGSGGPENGLSALAFTAADAKLGWIRNETAPNGRPVRRVLVLVTDEDDLLTLGRPRNRTEFRGDGTDTCKTSKPPTHMILREVFEKYQMTVIALLAVTKLRPDIVERYQKHFDEIGGSTKFCIREFALRSQSRGIVFTNMKNDFKIPADFWAGEKVNEESERNINPKGIKFPKNDIKKISTDPPTVKAGQYDHLVEFVIDCLRKTDDRGNCVYGDPEGINTLGF